MDAEEAEKSAPGSNAMGRDAKFQATVEEKADMPTQDSQGSTKAAEEMADTGGQRDSQETIEEDISDNVEIGTSEASAGDTAATAGSVPRNATCNAWSVEAHFRIRQITSQQTKYGHLVFSLPPDVAEGIADILASPHAGQPYNTLKAAIISRKSESDDSRLQQPITATELGDRRPSQLLRHMLQLLGGPSAPQEEKLLRELFLQRLPQSMVPVHVAAGAVPVDTLAEMANRVADYSRAHSLNAVTTPPPATAADPALASIENRLDALVRRLDDFVPAHRRPSSKFQLHSRSSTPPSLSGSSANRRATGRLIHCYALAVCPPVTFLVCPLTRSAQVGPVPCSAGSWMLTLSLRDRELERPVDLDLLLDCDRPSEQERGLEPFRPRETDRPLSSEEALSGLGLLSSASTR
ncbi:hypothetical protein MTO96_019620 [Rhipicephalus appendiculatus]